VFETALDVALRGVPRGAPQVRGLLGHPPGVEAIVAAECAKARRLILRPGVKVVFVEVTGGSVGHGILPPTNLADQSDMQMR
jgi:hypothetical protein